MEPILTKAKFNYLLVILEVTENTKKNMSI
jgi:hypothetical protein